MHGTSRFQSSRRRGHGYAAAASDAAAASAAATPAAASAPATTKGFSLSDQTASDLIDAFEGIGKTAITTIGGIETARITGKSPTTSTGLRATPAPGRTVSGGGGGGGSGISGTTLAVGGLVVVGLGVGAYFVFRRK